MTAIDRVDMSRDVPVLVVVLVLAGCSAPAAPGAPATPAAVPTDRPVPPGLAEGTVVDASAVVDAHDRALADTSFTVVRTAEVVFPNGTVHARETRTTRVGTGGAYLDVRDRQAGRRAVFGDSYVETWSDGTRTLVRYERNDATVLELSPDHGEDRRQHVTRPDGSQFGPVLAGDARRTVRRVGSDGGTRFVVTARSDSPLGVGIPRPRGFVVDAPLTYRLVVELDGVVRRMEVHAEGRFVGGGNATLTYAVRYSAVGETSVERPPWAA